MGSLFQNFLNQIKGIVGMSTTHKTIVYFDSLTHQLSDTEYLAELVNLKIMITTLLFAETEAQKLNKSN